MTAPAAPADVSDAAIEALYADPELRLWAAIRELWSYGAEHQALADKLAKLDAQLADPALMGHPKRPEALETRAKITAKLDGIAWEARQIQGMIEGVWRRIPKPRQEAIRQPGFPRPASAARLGPELWAMSKAQRPIAGMAPF